MIRYEASDRRATITIDEVERRNPMSAEAMAGLVDATRRALADDAVRVLVYTGAGDAAFCAGGDLSAGFVDDPIGLHHSRGALADLFRLMVRGGKPTVARVNGHALAGGFGLAVACDIVVCVDDAKLGTPEINVGLWPMMISAVLVRSMPRKAVLELMMTGRIITPDEAHRLGAITHVVSRDELDNVVDEIVGSLASKSPAVMELGRDSFYAIADMDFDAALDRLQAGLTAVSLTEDSKEGVQAFLEKRQPIWQGR
ncbi:MAG TPA: enoyl-CoA hydratase-related protein [Acidimicrobiia bacterium]|nr:enoyl-CoA hydratase-related protein [Acidimicrobiia bacterium]